VLKRFEYEEKAAGRRQTMTLLVSIFLGCVPVGLMRLTLGGTFNSNG
jgi:hypothetical protein